MKVKSITISGMHNVTKKTYTFNDINYLYGPNGSGKTTVLNAIQLAILGYIPGTAKLSSNIFKHANQPEMKVYLEFDNGNYIERTWKLKGRSISTDVKTNTGLEDVSTLVGDLELPIFNFNELINMTANKLKDWFINFLPSGSSNLDWKNELEKSLNGLQLMDKTLIDSTLNAINSISADNTLSLIQKVNDYFKEEQKYLKEELKRFDATIQSLVYYDEEDLVGDSEYLDEKIKSLHQFIQSLTDTKEKLISAMQIIQSNQKIKNQLESIPATTVDVTELQKQVNILTQEITSIQSKIQKLDLQMQKSYADGSEYATEIKTKTSIISGNGICPYTQTQCESMEEIIKTLQEEVKELTENRNKVQEEINQIQIQSNELKKQLNKKQQEINQINAQIMSIQSKEIQRKQLSNLLVDAPDISQFKDLNYYTTEIAKVHEIITKIESNKRYSQLIDSFTSDKFRIENTLEAYKSWIKLTDPNGLPTRVMQEPFENLTQDMNHYLNMMFAEHISCKFNLEYKTNSFSFGIIRYNDDSDMNSNYNEKYIPYDLLSQGEKTMYTFAMMLCIISRSNSELKLLIVDDIVDHLDNDRADDVFSAIGQITDTQIIIAGIKESPSANMYSIKVVK